MSPMERLQAAIDKLERLKAESTPGPWTIQGESWDGAGRFEVVAEHIPELVTSDGDGIGSVSGPNADLIVTLHRTIDAQLAILRFAVDGLYDLPEFVALADAILGGES